MKKSTFLVSFGILFPIMLCLLLFAPSLGLSEPLDNWHLRNPLPTPNSLSAAASGSGITVAVGQNGTIVASTDGVNWSLETSGTTRNLRGVAFGGGRFVAVGYEQTILTSTDGITWTPVTAGIAGYLDFDGIAYGNGLFVMACGGNGTIATSPDGETWTQQAYATTNGPSGFAFGNGLIVTVGYGGVVLTSPDGATWRPASAGASNHLKSVAYGDHIFVAVGSSGRIMTSADGETWTPQTSGATNDFNSITYGNGTFVAGGYGGAVLTSPDGVVWTPQTSGVNDELNNIIYNQDHFIAVGSSGVILTSTDGRTWIPRTSGVRVFFYDVIHGNNTFVAMGKSGTVATSSDGLSWTSQVIGTGNGIRTGVYGNGAFIAWQWGTLWQILTSSDGIHWGASLWELGIPSAVGYGNGLFVAVGYGGAIRTSEDGQTWTSRTSGTSIELNGIACGNGLFVAVGGGGAVLTSPDGINWSRSTSAAGGFSNIAFGNGRFVALGSGGAIFVSSDGTNWIKRSPGTGSSPTDIAFGHHAFAIAGYSGNSGTIHTSAYGLLWSPRIVEQVPMLTGIAYGNDTFVAAGASGAIFQSDSLTNSVAMDSDAIEALYLEVESFLAEENLGGIMALYHHGYGNGGSTKAMAQDRYGKMFGDYADIKAVFNLSGLTVDGDNATLTETLTWQGTRVSTGEVHSRTETAKAYLKKVGAAWKFYGDQVTYGVTVQSNHDAWSGEFGVSIRIFDPNRTITALSASGPGIAGNLDMTSFAYDLATTSWRSISSIKVGDGSHYPSLSSLIYAVSITDARGGSLHEVAVAGLQTALTVNYAGPANVAVRGGLTFRWVADETNSPVYYRVLLYRGACPSPGTPPPGSPLWVSPPVAGVPHRPGSISWNEAPTSVRYSGPALPNGDYSFVVQAVDSYGNTTSAKAESFRKAVGQGSLLDVWHERNPHISLSDASSSACGNDICVYPYVYPFVKGRITVHNLATDAPWEAEVGVDAALHGAAYGNGTFVVVGDGGAIVASQDAMTWTVASSGTTNSLMRVAYGNNVFVAIGDSGTILTSPNGVAWTARSSGTIGNLSGIIYQNETFIVADASGLILTSTDGTAWTSNPAWTANNLMMVAYGNGASVTVDNTGAVRTSAGGENWAISMAGLGPGIDGLAYGNGIFVAVGGMAIFTSTDGIAWTPRVSGTTRSLYGVRFILDRFWAVGESGTMLTSFDGVTWTPKTSGTADLLYDIAYGANRFVAMGRYGILTSSDGQVWSVTNQEGNSDVVRIAYGNHRFIALDAYGTILTSSDGVTWMRSSIGAYDEDVQIAVATRSVLEEDPISGSYQGSSSDASVPVSPPSSWLENQFRDITQLSQE